jgi:hypothetical protein
VRKPCATPAQPRVGCLSRAKSAGATACADGLPACQANPQLIPDQHAFKTMLLQLKPGRSHLVHTCSCWLDPDGRSAPHLTLTNILAKGVCVPAPAHLDCVCWVVHQRQKDVAASAVGIRTSNGQSKVLGKHAKVGRISCRSSSNVQQGEMGAPKSI